MGRQFTSESVTEGHPDKVADAISDSVLDAMLADDPGSHTAVETLVANGVVIVTGEATTESYVDIQKLARERLLAIGFDSAEKGIDGGSCGVMVTLNNQSPDIAQGVTGSWEARHGEAVDDFDLQGAGDQGLMFGFACDETPELMPLPIQMAHRMAERLTQVRRDETLGYLRPDGKTQITIDYDDAGKPVGVDTVVVSAQHRADIDVAARLDPDIRREVIAPVLESFGFKTGSPRVLINPTGRFVIGGPAGDAGLTGRKIIVDTYGGMARHGGGAFSGKDPSKVDRSASYAMRWVAKNIVAAGLAARCEAQVSYAIGTANPTSLYIDTFGTGEVPDRQIAAAVREVFDLRPAAIVQTLDLRRPIYKEVSCYGHFGRELPDITWERTDRADELARKVRG
ncbi:methionine adenosyltransferase [Propionimicrobium sp. PCR01-08-3]|uniref:methionine adenosyltransferase n=1 Tax=Propionimicrobium sp. PCR01-08-3 TaxID=3052086 RepID=UPI00255CAD31|nr:methionine adenosyltransferase [Propionimicrobium sp. PCR01-08-3]WIY83903.1 methionine adenosyltransferase [Propionimicrobium sp. PCR01-08-3]